MPATEIQRQSYRDKFRSLHNEAFQTWFEQLLNALHPAGDFQAIRKTAGDGGLDGFVISAQLVYQAYAPARINELRDSKVAAKIRVDFAKAQHTLEGRLKVWTFVHNHPEGRIGKRSAAAISHLKAEHPDVEVSVLNIDSLWEKLRPLPDTQLSQLFGPAAPDDLHAKLLLAEDYMLSSESTKAASLFKEVLFAADSADRLNSRVTALLGLFVVSLNHRDQGAAEEYLREAEGALDKLTDDGLRIHVLRAKANLLDHRRDDGASETAYREAIAVPITGSDKYVDEALITTKVDFALFYCRTKRAELAEPLIRECEAFVADSIGKRNHTLLPHIIDAAISHALCVGDRDATLRAIRLLEEKAGTQALAREFGLLLERLGQRALHLKAYDLGVQCCEAAVRLAHKAKRDDDAVAAEHAAVLLLCEKGDLDTAKAMCEVLLAHVRAGSDRVLHAGVADLWGRIAHKLGDYDTAASAAAEAMENTGDNLMATVGMRHNLARALCDAGRVDQGLEHARAAYSLAKKIEASPPFHADLLFLVANAACLLGDWKATDEALAELGRLPELPEEFEERRKNLVCRIEGCRFLRCRLEVFASDPKPLETAGTSTSSTVWEANTAVISALLDWWKEAPGDDIPPGYDRLPESHYPKNLSILYDYWGRGNMSRVLLNLRGFSHTLNLTLEVRTLEEVKRAVRVFALFTDALILLWKGPLWSRQVVPIVPAFNGVEGGAGYVIFPTDPQEYRRSTERSGDWFPAVGYGSFLPDDVIAFLFEEALPLLRLGRLFVIPASAVGCIHEGHGPFESLFAELCSATPTLRSDPSKQQFPIGWVPYFPDAPLALLADVIRENPEALRRLRLLLIKRTRELKDHREAAGASKELETEISDALAELKTLQLRVKRKSGWEVDAEGMGNSAVGFTRNDLLGAAWRNGTGSYLYSYGRPEAAVAAAEWMPVLTLESLGYDWRVEPTAGLRKVSDRRRGPEPGEAVGAWLAPRGHDVRVAAIRKSK